MLNGQRAHLTSRGDFVYYSSGVRTLIHAQEIQAVTIPPKVFVLFFVPRLVWYAKITLKDGAVHKVLNLHAEAVALFQAMCSDNHVTIIENEKEVGMTIGHIVRDTSGNVPKWLTPFLLVVTVVLLLLSVLLSLGVLGSN